MITDEEEEEEDEDDENDDRDDGNVTVVAERSRFSHP